MKSSRKHWSFIRQSIRIVAQAPLQSFLVIQTAFIGDAILATAVIEKLHKHYPQAHIDFLVRKGNESLLTGHPFLREVLIWDKKQGKIKNLIRIIQSIRSRKYDCVINLHRYTSTGMISAFSGARIIAGFNKNPISFLFTHKVKHEFGSGIHEIERNQKVIEFLTDHDTEKPRLYPTLNDRERVQSYQSGTYCCLAPTSVWFTKQWPANLWIQFIQSIQNKVDHIYLLGAPGDHATCEMIRTQSGGKAINLAGQLTFLQSAALLQGAVMNFVNDSAPMHLASATNAPVTAIYCSTIPEFGFGPLSAQSHIVQTKELLDCRPCGSHGHRSCPRGHFRCATSIPVEALQKCLTV